MNKNKSPYFFVSIVIAFMAFMTSPGTGMAQSGSAGLEQEYSNKANQFLADKNYEQAAFVLEELLAAYPDLTDETVYKQLTHIYDDYLFNFEKACVYYKKYLDRFPEGEFADAFRDRVTYLNERRSEWEALRSFNKVRLEEDHTPIKKTLEEVETILSKNANALIAPEMHFYLAGKYVEAAEYQKANEHAEQYIHYFDKAGMSNTDKALALNLYAGILVKQHRYDQAIRALDQAMELGNPGENFNFAVEKSNLIYQRNLLYGFAICLLYYILVFILLIPVKFWRHFILQHDAGRLAMPLLLLALISLSPVLILHIIQEPEADLRFFFVLLILTILSFMLIRLLAPLSLKTGKWVYILMSGLHAGAASFITYYMTAYNGRNIIMSTVVEADKDPAAPLYLMLMWSSVAAAILINVIYALLNTKKKQAAELR